MKCHHFLLHFTVFEKSHYFQLVFSWRALFCYLYEHTRVLEVSNRRDQLVWLQESQLPSQQLDSKMWAVLHVLDETEGKLKQQHVELGILHMSKSYKLIFTLKTYHLIQVSETTTNKQKCGKFNFGSLRNKMFRYHQDFKNSNRSLLSFYVWFITLGT